MNLAILLTNGHRVLSLAAAVDIFETVNRLLEESGKESFYAISVIGNAGREKVPVYLESYPYYTIEDNFYTADLVLVPAFQSRDMQLNIFENRSFVNFLAGQYQKGASLVSLCTGAFLLGAGGLLDGKDATTHIDAVEYLAAAFPAARVMPHAVLTKNERIYTSGGAICSFHMKLWLIQQHCGREMAVRIAKEFAIDMDRSNQLHFEHFKPTVYEGDLVVRAVQVHINNRYGEMKNVEEAMDEVPASRRNIIRRFKLATGMTPIKYLQKTKVEAAKQLLENTNREILDVMLATGYNDLKSFRQVFRSFTGLNPSEYRVKYGMRME